jgi:hypothetical protein
MTGIVFAVACPENLVSAKVIKGVRTRLGILYPQPSRRAPFREVQTFGRRASLFPDFFFVELYNQTPFMFIKLSWAAFGFPAPSIGNKDGVFVGTIAVWTWPLSLLPVYLFEEVV